MHKKLLMVAVAAASLVLTACGSGSDSKGTTADSLTQVTIGAPKLSFSVPLVLGQEKGFFKEAGLDIKFKNVEMASVVPAVVSGDVDFTYNSAIGLLTARNNKLPIVAVTSGNRWSTDPLQQTPHLFVSSNSDITSPKQLEGKRIAVDSLYQMPHLTLVNALAASGVDTTKVKFIELPSNAQLDALNKGQVDAVDLLDPFIAKGLKAKAIKPLLSNTVGLPDKSLIGVWMTSQNFVNEHADTVQKFVDATNKSLAYAQAHPDEFRATFAKFADVDPNLASQLRMHNYEPGLESSDLDVYADLLGTYGADKKRPDTKGAIYVGKG